jgi:hypothetical protein
MRQLQGWGAAVAVPAIILAIAAGIGIAGCGTEAAPMPPSLNLPDRVQDLAAVRTGSQVSLTWTMPRKNTDKLLLKSNVQVRVCRGGNKCDSAVAEMSLAPGADGAFTDNLPASLTAGSPRELNYFVDLRNRKGRSAGLSNAATVLAGEAPMPVAGLAAEVRKAGVVLKWTPNRESASVRLHRTLMTPPKEKSKEDLSAPPPEPLQQILLVDTGAQTGHAIDKDIRFGQTYEYTAQRVARVNLEGKTLEIASGISAPVRVEALDVFPPEVPTGLAAVATAGGNGAETAIDLSWQPGTESDLAGYIVYRHEGDGPWQRISAAQPVVGPAFHDAAVQSGHTYQYAVSAIDQGGHESARSAETQETVPAP